MSKRGCIRPGVLVTWREWFHDPFQPIVGDGQIGLVVKESSTGGTSPEMRTEVLVPGGTVVEIDSRKLRVVSRPYVKYKGIKVG